jgi:Zn-dependent protease
MGPLSLAFLCLAGLAWGLMPVDPTRFRSRYGEALVAFAGPAVNLLLGTLALSALAIWAGGGLAEDGTPTRNAQQFLLILGQLNLVLFLLNLLPLPPLDGSAVLGSFVPRFREFSANPDNQPIFLGGLLLVFFFAGRLFDVARRASEAYLSFWAA